MALIPHNDIPAVRARLAIIEQKQLELSALQGDFRRFLAQVCEVDLDREVWELDEAHWLLVQCADAQGNATAGA